MTKLVRWGILGTGRIAGLFSTDLKKTRDAAAMAVASRSYERAENFAAKHHIPRVYGCYEALAKDPEIDVIYIATPHSHHKEHTLLCLANGKHVLCEKPFAVNAKEARQMIAYARERNLFLMEAMWSRFNPVYQRAMQWVNEGLVGEVRMLKADFGFRTVWEPEGRLLNPALAGGSILDVAIYPLAMASHLFGLRPAAIHALAHKGASGVDEQAGIVLKYANGQLAVLASAIRTRIPNQALILGTEGLIWLPVFWRARLAVLWRSRKIPRITWGRIGYQYEAAEVGSCLRQNRIESTVMPLAESIAIAEIMDQVRAMIGMQYPGE